MPNNTPKRNNNDIEELESAFARLANKRKTAKSGKYAKARDEKVTTILIICISAFLILAIAGGIMLFNIAPKNDIISKDVSVMGVSLNGMSTTDAVKAINKAFSEKYGSTVVKIEIEGVTVKLNPSELSAGLNVEQIITDVLADTYQSENLASYLVVDKRIVLKKITASVPTMTAPMTASTYKVEGTKPTAFDKIDENAALVLHMTKGTAGKSLDNNAVIEAVKDALWTQKTIISYQCPITEPEPLDFEAITAEHCTLPVDALYDTETFQISGGTMGYLFDTEKAAAALEAAQYGETITVAFEWVTPEHTLEELNEVLFRDVLATYTTKAGWDSNRNVNLRLACEAINGIVMNPGDVFSYNETLGQRTPEKGYKPGASYVGGETVYDYGGGICQVSSTLYYCTVVSDLEIVERDCHGYASSYIPLSMDATVFWGGIDYKFRNNSDYPIRIEAHAEGGNVTVSIVGTDYKDYYVKFEYEHLATYPFEVIYKEMKADNEKGFKDGDIITSAYTGYKSKGYRVKYDKATDKEIERILESTDVYSKRDRVICKIVEDATEPTEPVPTDPLEPTIPVEPSESIQPDPSNDSTTEAPTDPPTEAPTVPPTEAPYASDGAAA